MAVLSGILLLHELSWIFSGLIRDVVTIYFSKWRKKPPDIEVVPTHSTIPDPAPHTVSRTSFVACSTALTNRLDDKGCYNESFDSEDTFMVGLDSLCSRHLFPSKSDFVSQILPIDPFGIQGVGGGYKGNWQRNCSSLVPL